MQEVEMKSLNDRVKRARARAGIPCRRFRRPVRRVRLLLTAADATERESGGPKS